ncbi:NUDIX domain-containing protein [Arcicella aurantiaca]|uniref:NUDIX domain-containing protein n=1 Tax=Arcicella aurantiaca TaxID=591202 RepID=A0A316DVY9_9BACT|nr:NUDIX domain-containing protein [Arcicella aurantiaca]PWK21618.1 NUDIX domain-containing protein [Arcicella aurantiaca]
MNHFNSQTYIPQLAIDCVIFGYKEKELKVLVSKIHFKGDIYSLPSGFIFQHEGVDEAAHRILKERTGIANIFLEHYQNFGQANRTNKAIFQKIIEKNREFFESEKIIFTQADLEWLTSRFVSLGYYALVDINKVTLTKTEMDESMEWYNIHELPNLMMDHEEMVKKALKYLRLHLDTNIIVFNLLPETFIMKEVQDLYETIYEETYSRNNFQKKILDLKVLERLEKKFTGAQNKAPYLYRFKR